MIKIIIKYLKALSTLIYLLYNKKLKFSINHLKNNDLLLIDDNTEKYLKRYILDKINYVSISTRPNEKFGTYYLNLKIFFLILIGLNKKLNLKSSYVYAIIKLIKPKVVLENTHDWNTLLIANEFKKIKFFMLLQGSWFFLLEDGKKFIPRILQYELPKLKTDNMENFTIFLWGKKDQEILEELGVNKRIKNCNLKKVGSYEASYYNRLYRGKFNENNSIIFISQLHPMILSSENEISQVIQKDTIAAIKLILNYVKKRNLEFFYINRSHNNERHIEENFILRNINDLDKTNIILNTNDNLWKEIFKSKIVTSICSTVAQDAIYLKKKTILIPLNHSKIYKWSSSKYKDDKDFWPWTIESNNQSNFNHICDHIANLTQNEYEQKISKLHSYWFHQNDYESDKIIQQNLKQYIS